MEGESLTSPLWIISTVKRRMEGLITNHVRKFNLFLYASVLFHHHYICPRVQHILGEMIENEQLKKQQINFKSFRASHSSKAFCNKSFQQKSICGITKLSKNQLNEKEGDSQES
ncbi:uncharacterized protein LOC129129419 isoform X2 [Agelaius phoeniceus]|uniref:uncharacterized protein LOC129129419 isoform X2 n=1 Tax=Agelaius phoeniceus TaxID=39638 RepID=UPI004054BF5D